MAPEEDRPPPWAGDAKVFGGFVLLNAVLVCVGVYGALAWSWGQVAEVWLWVFAFPCMAIGSLGAPALGESLLWVNPPIYGLVWWLAWRTVRLMRAKEAEDTAHPPN